MIWERLKNMRCPDCNGRLIDLDEYGVYRCCLCHFRIKEQRFNEIAADLYKPKSYTEVEDNQEALNNL